MIQVIATLVDTGNAGIKRKHPSSATRVKKSQTPIHYYDTPKPHPNRTQPQFKQPNGNERIQLIPRTIFRNKGN